MAEHPTSETLIHISSEPLKSLEVKDGIARVGAYGIRFSGPDQKDLTGEYFTAATDYGPRNGDGVTTMFNHGYLPIDDDAEESVRKTLETAVARTYGAVKTTKDNIGIFVETVLNLSDEYEAAIAGLVDAGRLKWSSGSASHLVRKSVEGEILRWHPVEFSYTPTPAESRLPAIAPLKSYQAGQNLEGIAKVFVPATPTPAPTPPPVTHNVTVAPLTYTGTSSLNYVTTLFPVDSGKAVDSRPKISVSTPNKMTQEEIAAKTAEIEKAANDRANARIKDAQEILAIGAAFGKTKEADEFVKNGRSLSEFQTEVLTSLKARPVQADAGVVGMTEKETKRYSLRKACLDLATKGHLEGLEKEAHEAAMKACGRSIDTKGFIIPEDVVRGFGRVPVKTANQVSVGTAGGFLVETDFGPMIELLRNKPQVVNAGATTLAGLVGDVILPVQSGTTTAYWVAETAALTDSNATFAQKKLTPKRLGVSIPYSTQLLAQTSMDVESLIRDDAVRVLSLEKDRAALAGTGAAGEPLGVELTSGINATVTYSGAAEWADIVEHETGIAVDNADIGSMAFIINAATRGKWKTALKIATYGGSGYLIDSDNTANGYPVFVTNQTFSTASQSHFGCWNQLLLASWAGMEVIVDPFALKKSAQVEIVFNELCDILVRQPLAFNVSTDTAAA